jgi:hypothetical protein
MRYATPPMAGLSLESFARRIASVGALRNASYAGVCGNKICEVGEQTREAATAPEKDLVNYRLFLELLIQKSICPDWTMLLRVRGKLLRIMIVYCNGSTE